MFSMSGEGKPVLQRTDEEIADFRGQLQEAANNPENAGEYADFCKGWAQELTEHLESHKQSNK